MSTQEVRSSRAVSESQGIQPALYQEHRSWLAVRPPFSVQQVDSRQSLEPSTEVSGHVRSYCRITVHISYSRPIPSG